MSGRRTLPLVDVRSARTNRSDGPYSPDAPSSSSSSPSSPGSRYNSACHSPNSALFVENAFKSAEERVQAEFRNLRVSCSQALLSEQLRAERLREESKRLRAESMSYLQERNFAWAKMKALMAEQMGDQRQADVRRARSMSAIPRSQMPKASRASRSLSPHLLAAGVYPKPSAASLTSSLVNVKREETPVSLTSSCTSSPISPTETLVADDPWALLYPDAKSRSFDDKRPIYATEPATLGTEHIDVVFKQMHRTLICRMCILERSKLPKDKQGEFPVASYDTDTLGMNLTMHCLAKHMRESLDLAKLPQSVLSEMVEGFSRTEREEDFHIDYTYTCAPRI
ncbi:hypothetical protein DXG01_001964 [Tephrocybe rancida]|nr:hypothetical protein DXG01_001964 [Tephrocybe rancida]